jgi:hypothetical protein
MRAHFGSRAVPFVTGCLLLLFVLVGHVAEADSVTYAFTGTVTSVHPSLTGTFDTSMRLSGSFTYEDSTPGSLCFNCSESQGFSSYPHALTNLVMRVGTYTASPPFGTDVFSGMQVLNNFVGSSGFNVASRLSGTPFNGFTPVAALDFETLAPGVFSSTKLADVGDLSGWTSRHAGAFWYIAFDCCGGQPGISGAITSITRVPNSTSGSGQTTYFYVGNPFNNRGGVDQCPPVCGITGSFTTSEPLPANLPLTPVSPKAFSFTDGLNAVSSPYSFYSVFLVSTDAKGNIVNWDIEFWDPANGFLPPPVLILSTFNESGLANTGQPSDFSCTSPCTFPLTNFANVVDAPGAWSFTVATVLVSNFGPGGTYQNGTGTGWATGDGDNSSNAVSWLNSSGKPFQLDRFRFAANWFNGENTLSVGFWGGSTDLNSATLLESFTFSATAFRTPQIFTAVSNAHPSITPGGTYFITLSVPGTPETLWGWQWNDRGQNGYLARFGGNAWFTEPFATPVFEVLGVPADVPACAFSVSPTGRDFGPEGGLGSFAVTTTAPCGWSASSNVSWISVLPGSLCTRVGDVAHCPSGPGTVNFAVATNKDVTGRTGVISVGESHFSVSQQPLACTFSVNPLTAWLDSAGGDIRVTVTTPASCVVTAVSNISWLSVTSVTKGGQGATVVLHATSNTTSERSGTATIAGSIVKVTQGAGACGALDVTSRVKVTQGGLTWIPPSTLYGQTISLLNSSSSVIQGPVYLVLLGQPSHNPPGFPLDYSNSGLVLPPPLTTCFSPKGDYLLPIATNLQPGQIVTKSLTWIVGYFATASFSPKVLSGTPSR